ncbi:MAG: O-antigen ligase family protein [Patescibacteria group bacterium]|mgnify:CR=1 FL=1
MSTFFNKTSLSIFFSIVAIELLSFLSYLCPVINSAEFFVIALITLILSFYNLKYGILITLAELFIGSKGHLFYFDFGDFTISIRMALWLIVMGVWIGNVIYNVIKNKKIEIEFLKSQYAKYFILLFIFIAWGIINGILSGNNLSNVFYDFNGWIYFLLIFPIYSIAKTQGSSFYNNLIQVFIAAVAWLSIKTLILLYILSHNSMDMFSYELYSWSRNSGIGEIAQMKSGFSRIFFQSHIFVSIGLFLFLSVFKEKISKTLGYKKDFLLFCCLSILTATIVITFSRSFWVGIIAGLILFLTVLVQQKNNIHKIGKILLNIFLATMFGFLIIIAIIKFPIPQSMKDFNFSPDLLFERMSNLNEAAVASRWNLLPPLWQQITEAPILGSGFGTTITYKSSDPRALRKNPTGEYTTYAFEWGWLDIWLKLGIGGLIIYIFLIGKIIFDGLKQCTKCNISLGLSIGLLIIFVAHIFSPYLNHPLGIGYLILVSVFLSKNTKFIF